MYVSEALFASLHLILNAYPHVLQYPPLFPHFGSTAYHHLNAVAGGLLSVQQTLTFDQPSAES